MRTKSAECLRKMFAVGLIHMRSAAEYGVLMWDFGDHKI